MMIKTTFSKEKSPGSTAANIESLLQLCFIPLFLVLVHLLKIDRHFTCFTTSILQHAPVWRAVLCHKSSSADLFLTTTLLDTLIVAYFSAERKTCNSQRYLLFARLSASPPRVPRHAIWFIITTHSFPPFFFFVFCLALVSCKSKTNDGWFLLLLLLLFTPPWLPASLPPRLPLQLAIQ